MDVVPGFCALVKSQQDDSSSDSYINELQKINLEPVIVPALRFAFVNSDCLLNCLQCFGNYVGLIFTSSRVVEAVINAFSPVDETDREQILSEWRKKRNFAVGQTTSNIAESKLQIICSGQSSGSAEALVSFILEQTDLPTLPFLYPCSNLANDDIVTLGKYGKEVEKLVVYETCPHPLLHETIETFVNTKGIPEIWIFFSPSSVKYLFPILLTLNISLNLIKIVAIGGTTKRALESEGVTPWCVASRPNAASLSQAISSAILR